MHNAIRIICFCLLSSLLWAGDLPIDSAQLMLNATPLYQVTGDLQQQYNATYGGAFGIPTKNLASTNYGVALFDEGASTLLGDGRILTVYGDTVAVRGSGGKLLDYQQRTTCPNATNTASSGVSGGFSGGSGGCLGVKAVSLYAAGSDWSACNVTAQIDAMLTAGVTPVLNTNWDWSHCPQEVFITNSNHASLSPPAPAMVTPIIHNMPIPDCCTSVQNVFNAGHEPTALWVDPSNYLWMAGHVANQNRSGSLKYILTGLAMKSRSTTDTFTATSIGGSAADLDFDVVVTMSAAPAILNGTLDSDGAGNLTRKTGSNFGSYFITPAHLIINVATTGGAAQECEIVSYTDTDHIGITPSNCLGTSPLTGVSWEVMQQESLNSGKFIQAAVYTFDPSTVAWKTSLPSALQSAAQVTCFFGSGGATWRRSNLYLGCIDQSLIATSSWSGGHGANSAAAGLSNMWYLTAGPSGMANNYLGPASVPLTQPAPQPVAWQQGAHEQNAVPLLTTMSHTSSAKYLQNFGIGEHSVRWIPPLGRFVLTYCSAETSGCWLRTATYPWGPWSKEVQFEPNGRTQFWPIRLVTSPGAPPPPDFNLPVALNLPLTCASAYNSVCTNQMYDDTATGNQMGVDTIVSPWGQPGNWYGAYLLPTWTDNGGTVDIYVRMSAFDPYTSFVSRITLTKPGTLFTGNIKLQ